MDLETFIIRYITNAANALKGNAEVKKSNETVVNSYKKVDAQSSLVAKNFKRVAIQAAAALAAFFSARAISSNINQVANFADKLGKLSDALNVNIEDLSAWGDAVGLSGGSAESFQESVKTVTASLVDFATKGRSRVAPFFQALGIQMVDAKGKAREFFDVLPELAEQFQKLSKSESFGIGRKLGLDEGTINLLQRGRKEVEALVKQQRELGVVTRRQAEVAAKFNDQWTRIRHAFRTFWLQIAEQLLPVLEKFGKGIERFMVTIIRNWDKVLPILKVMGAVFMALLTPIVAIGGAIATLFLLFEDLLIYLEGGDSLIGHWIENSKELAVTFGYVKVALDALKIAYKEVGAVFAAIGGFILQLWLDILDVILMIPKAISSLVNVSASAIDSVKNLFGGDKKKRNDVVNTLHDMENSPLNTAAANQSVFSSNKSLRRNTSVSIGEINIQTEATDAQDISYGIANGMRDEIRQLFDTADDGLLA
jgi:TP901 family phage tail tape measure protein